MMQSAVVWWIRRDLRIKNNFALRKALETGMSVIPVFIIDPLFESTSGTPRQKFLYQGLNFLNSALHEHGAYIVVRTGQPKEIFARLFREVNILNIFAEEDYSAYGQSRDAEVSIEFPLELVGGLTLQHPALIYSQKGTPYTVFTPYKNAWQQLPWHSSLDWIPKNPLNTPPGIFSEPIPNYPSFSEFPAGEESAEAKLRQFLVDGITTYDQNRDRMDLDGTSKLSPYLKTGQISIHSMWNANQAEFNSQPMDMHNPGVTVWKNELIWREFYQYILYHFPSVQKQAFKPDLREIKWNEPGSNFDAWKQGLTGFPIIDAAMRQLLSTGWMHNRARMITASFLSKDLLINWQEGESWFMKNLIDGDVAANNGGWQWSAGVGTDAATLFPHL